MGIGPVPLVIDRPDATDAGYLLRPMAAGDLEQVLRIEGEWAPTPWSRPTFENELGVPFSRASVLHAAGHSEVVSGYVVRWSVAGEFHLLSLAVRAEERRQGLGGLMIDDLLVEARATGADLVTLEVEAANDAAVALYRSRGFTEVRRRKGYYGRGRDALAMDLALGRAVS